MSSRRLSKNVINEKLEKMKFRPAPIFLDWESTQWQKQTLRLVQTVFIINTIITQLPPCLWFALKKESVLVSLLNFINVNKITKTLRIIIYFFFFLFFFKVVAYLQNTQCKKKASPLVSLDRLLTLLLLQQVKNPADEVAWGLTSSATGPALIEQRTVRRGRVDFLLKSLHSSLILWHIVNHVYIGWLGFLCCSCSKWWLLNDCRPGQMHPDCIF